MDTDKELEAVGMLLDLPEYEVVAVTRDPSRKRSRITLVPKALVGLCPQCGVVCGKRHLCRDREVRDLPMGGWSTELIVQMWQFECGHCGRFHTPRFSALAEGAHATERLLERLAELAGRGDVSLAARFFGIPEKTGEEWYYGYLKRSPKSQPDLKPVRSLGVDELSLKKGTASSAPC
jgi:transposase